MFASVAERVREIGLRKALGAKNRDILCQLLVESTTLSSAGGVLGALVGMGLGLAIGHLTSLPVQVDTGAILLSVGFAVCMGIIAGIHPAMRAARVSPIEALRSC